MWSVGSRRSGSVVAVPGLQITGSVVVAHGLSCPEACGISLDQGLNSSLLHWQEDSLTTEPPEKPEGHKTDKQPNQIGHQKSTLPSIRWKVQHKILREFSKLSY